MIHYKNIKKICIISDCYVPQKISAAGMIYNLSRNISDRGIEVTCVFSGEVPDLQSKVYEIKNIKFVTTTIVKSFRSKSLIFRFIFEILTSIMLSIKSFFYFQNDKKVDLIIWYGPSVFLWLVVKTVKYFNKVPVYYILRDIFPDWLINTNIVKNTILIKFLKIISEPQYVVSDVIGVETKENIKFVNNKIRDKKIKVQLLLNWPSLIKLKNKDNFYLLSNNIKNYIKSLSPNKLFGLYIGNAGIAHDYESAFNFLNNINEKSFKYNVDINIFGKSYNNIKHVNSFIIQNFWGLIPDYRLNNILSSAEFGIVTLNRKLITQNIPGKFVSYTQFGLPVIYFGHSESSLAGFIKQYDCGVIIDMKNNFKTNENIILTFLNNLKNNRTYYSKNSLKLFKENFDVNKSIDSIFANFNK